ncbi:2-oxo-4-hydroxy-4-carboxy-5-ureidoimidazoline decarboxylase [Microbacterium indicum]|uniref:2-oxo-4-hydroxy-4-carboxy-5-ureidoimidazoline decarboxylase n=1 Tax=Microbacterium indicum TaxID=358100 RepID=UPI000408D08A|nr:2-oxo-4-hydroxy-4-carboxy-5-ureidoimidazoline decarboxylase [Microbacterium indicum]
MQLSEFHGLPPEEARAVVTVWADVPAWVSRIVDARPFPSVEAVTDLAADAAREWSEADLDAALAQHPRIGARVAETSAEADHSRREQAAMASASGDVAARMAAGNAAYEERFGRVFLIRAAGRSPEEMLAELERRLENDPSDEWREAAAQLAEIALLRISQTLED